MKEGDLVEFWSSENGGTWKPAVVVDNVKYYSDFGASCRASQGTSEIRLMTGPGVFIIRAVKRKGKILIRPRVNHESEEHLHQHRIEILRASGSNGQPAQQEGSANSDPYHAD